MKQSPCVEYLLSITTYLRVLLPELIFNPIQSMSMGLNDSYHNHPYPINVRQNHWTLPPS